MREMKITAILSKAASHRIYSDSIIEKNALKEICVSLNG